jgi:hypothetical protein
MEGYQITTAYCLSHCGTIDFNARPVTDGMYAIPLYRISSSRSRFSLSGQAGLWLPVVGSRICAWRLDGVCVVGVRSPAV